MVVKELFASLGLNVESSGFVKADALLGALSNTLAAIGAAAGVGAVAIGVIIKETVDAGDAAAKAAQQYGITTDAVQALGYAAEFSGATFEQLGAAMAFLARKGSKDVEGDLRAIADTLAEMPDGSEKTRFVLDNLGRGAAVLIPLLNGGSASLDAFKAEAEDLGVILDKDLVAASEQLNDSFDRLLKVGLGALRRAFAPLIPDLLRVSEAIYKWTRANRELIRSNLAKVARGLHAAFVLLEESGSALNATLQWMIKWADGLALALGSYLFASTVVAAGGFKALGLAAVQAAVSAAAAWAAAAAPMLALAAIFFSVGAILEDIYVGIMGGNSVIIPALKAMFERLRDILTYWGQVIVNGIKSIGDAVKESFRGFVRVGIETVEGWIAAFTGFFSWIRDQFSLLSARAMAAFEAPLAAIRKLFGASPAPVGPESGQAPATVMGPPSFGGGDSPSASAGSSASRSIVSAPTFNGSFTVNAAPGQNPQEIAGAMRTEMDAWFDTKMRATAAAVGA